VSLNSLVLATIAFLISVSALAANKKRQIMLALATAVPAVAYATALVWEVSRRNYYYWPIAAAFIAPTLTYWGQYPKSRLQTLGGIVGLAAATLAAAWAVARGRLDLGLTVILAALYFAVAIFYWNRYRRRTAGVMTAVGGFALWGAVFPTAALLQTLVPSVTVEAEVWNIPKYLVAVGMILTLLEDQIEASKYLAYHDELTGLPNRRLLDDRLEQVLARAARTGTKVAVLQLDLDHFKEVNDTYGHRVGDLALQEVVTRLAGCVQPGDTLARSGGDEFTVLSNIAKFEEAEALKAALESALSVPIRVGNDEVNTGLSIGLALFPDDGTDADRLHAAADRAMYAAKRSARAPAALDARPQATA